MSPIADEVPMRKAMERAVLGKCPNCGKGALFTGYLKQVDHCAKCGESFAGFRPDDAAPWATIIVVGHIFLPLAFMIDLTTVMPLWGELTVWSLFFAAVSLALLPRAKGLMLAVLWHTRATAEPVIVL